MTYLYLALSVFAKNISPTYG